MQTYRLLKSIRALLFIFVSMSIIVVGIESQLAASDQEIRSAKDSSFKSFIKQVKQNYGKQYASHVEELFEVLLRDKTPAHFQHSQLQSIYGKTVNP